MKREESYSKLGYANARVVSNVQRTGRHPVGNHYHCALNATASAGVSRCIARLFAASNRAVLNGEPSATFSAFRLSRSPASLSARLRSGSSRSIESATTRITTEGIPIADATAAIE